MTNPTRQSLEDAYVLNGPDPFEGMSPEDREVAEENARMCMPKPGDDKAY